MSLVLLAAIAGLVPGQTSLIQQVGGNSWKYADDFFAANKQVPVSPLVRRAFASRASRTS